jgi:hypothetical protein
LEILMYIKENKPYSWNKTHKKNKNFYDEFYQDGGKKTKIDPYVPSKFRKKINLKDIQIDED